MKQLPDEKDLAELVEVARVAAEKAKAMSDLATALACKYKNQHDRHLVTRKQES